MLLQKACKILGKLNRPLWVVLFLCLSTNTRSQGIQAPVTFRSQCGPQGCQVPRNQCGPQGCQVPRGPVQPPRRVPDARQGGQRHSSEVRVKAVSGRVSQHGWASFVTYKGKQYLVSCAHTFKPGWENYATINGKTVKITLLTAGRISDITVWSAPIQHPNPLPLATEPATIGTTVTVAGHTGTVLGYVGSDIEVRANVQQGDSGGPIFSSQGLVAILTEYAPGQGRCIGPNVLLVSTLLDGLAGPPQKDERPMVPVDPPKIVVKPFDDANIRARLDALESQIAGVKINKDEIELHDGRISANEKRSRENTILIQRVVGAVESLQKEVVRNGKEVDTLSTKTRDLAVRMQSIEQTATTLSDTMKGKMQFRLRLDQDGRVTGVEPR